MGPIEKVLKEYKLYEETKENRVDVLTSLATIILYCVVISFAGKCIGIW